MQSWSSSLNLRILCSDCCFVFWRFVVNFLYSTFQYYSGWLFLCECIVTVSWIYFVWSASIIWAIHWSHGTVLNCLHWISFCTSTYIHTCNNVDFISHTTSTYKCNRLRNVCTKPSIRSLKQTSPHNLLSVSYKWNNLIEQVNLCSTTNYLGPLY